MQHRLWDCFRQQRTAEPVFASDVTIALSVFMSFRNSTCYARWWEALGYPAFVAIAVVFYLMVNKPALTF